MPTLLNLCEHRETFLLSDKICSHTGLYTRIGIRAGLPNDPLVILRGMFLHRNPENKWKQGDQSH